MSTVIKFKIDHLFPELMQQIRQFESEIAPQEIELWVLQEPKLGGSHKPSKERYHQIIVPILYHVKGEETSYYRICHNFFFYVTADGKFANYYGKSIPQLKKSIIIEKNTAAYLTHKNEIVRRLAGLVIQKPTLKEKFSTKDYYKNVNEFVDELQQTHTFTPKNITKNQIIIDTGVYHINLNLSIHRLTKQQLLESFNSFLKDAASLKADLKSKQRIKIVTEGILGTEEFKVYNYSIHPSSNHTYLNPINYRFDQDHPNSVEGFRNILQQNKLLKQILNYEEIYPQLQTLTNLILDRHPQFGHRSINLVIIPNSLSGKISIDIAQLFQRFRISVSTLKEMKQFLEKLKEIIIQHKPLGECEKWKTL